MSANTTLAIRIASIFDNKGLKGAQKGVKDLQGTVKKLAGAAGIGLSTAAVINFGKAAAKAFIADEKAASRLAMSVKNLGLGFETVRIEKFISGLSEASGVTDDVLRPSMQKLLQTTNSVAKSQELLTQALDISRGSGVDYETVVSDLTAAYLGQTKGLTKYSLGLTKAELKTMSFAEIQAKLTDEFKGANAQYLTTYAGKMELLNTAAGEAQETIGKGLVDALSLLAGKGNTVQPLADSMADFSVYVSDAIVGVAVLVDKLKKIPGMGESNAVSKGSFAMFPSLASLAILKKGLDYVSKTGAEYQALTNPVTQGYLGSMPVGIYPTPAELAKQRQMEKDRLKLEKERAALQKKANTEAKKKAALDKASQTLDLEGIGIAAALKGKISETDRLSLELQKAVLAGNATLATQLSDQLEAAIKRNNELRQSLLTTPEAPNPFRNWKVPEMGPLGGLAAGVIAGVNPNQVYPEPVAPVAPVAPPSFNVPQYSADSLTQYGPLGGLAAGVIAGVNMQPPVSVTVTLDGKELTSIITDTQINDTLSGSFSSVNRSGFKGAVAI
jgi:hypothetical protein